MRPRRLTLLLSLRMPVSQPETRRVSVPCLHCKLPLITLMASRLCCCLWGYCCQVLVTTQCLDYPGFEAGAVHFQYPLSGDTAVEISSAGPALMYPGYLCVCVCVCVCLFVFACLCVACV